MFTKAKNETAYAKIGDFGWQGAGKTYTACSIAIGLHKYIKAEKPVFFLDSEKGSDFAIV